METIVLAPGGGPRLFQAYWFLAPALVNKPAPKSRRRAVPYPRPPLSDSDRGEKREIGRAVRRGEAPWAGRGGSRPGPFGLPPYPPPGHGRRSAGNFASRPAASRRRRPLRAGVPLLVGAYLTPSTSSSSSSS